MSQKTETLVIGSGPGGYVAAIRAAQLGQKVTIVESTHIGGVCLNVGCIPSKALIHASHQYQDCLQAHLMGINLSSPEIDFAATQNWKDENVVRPLTSGVRALLNKNKITIIEGYAQFVSPKTVVIDTKQGKKSVDFQQAILATGSHPIEIPGFPFGQRIIDSTGALALKKIPDKLVIVGGGIIGTELGSAYANLGTKVTILEGFSQILPSYEKDIVQVVEASFEKKGIHMITNARAKKATATHDQIAVTYSVDGKESTITADYVMVTVGRRANTTTIGLEKIGITPDAQGLIPVNQYYQTKQVHIYAIGDIIAGPALAHKASHEGKIAAEVISGKKVKQDYLAIPTICFTDPEIATVGMTKKEALAAGKQAKSATFPMQANGRALSLNAKQGFIRLIFEKNSKLLLGAQLVGVGASELIAELTLAIESYLTLEDISLTIHGHPSLSEMIMDTAEIGLGFPIHL